MTQKFITHIYIIIIYNTHNVNAVYAVHISNRDDDVMAVQ